MKRAIKKIAFIISLLFFNLSVPVNSAEFFTIGSGASKNINFDDDWRIFSKNLYILHKNNPQNIKIIKEFIYQNINNYLKWGSYENYLHIDSFNLSISK